MQLQHTDLQLNVRVADIGWQSQPCTESDSFQHGGLQGSIT